MGNDLGKTLALMVKLDDDDLGVVKGVADVLLGGQTLIAMKPVSAVPASLRRAAQLIRRTGVSDPDIEGIARLTHKVSAAFVRRRGLPSNEPKWSGLPAKRQTEMMDACREALGVPVEPPAPRTNAGDEERGRITDDGDTYQGPRGTIFSCSYDTRDEWQGPNGHAVKLCAGAWVVSGPASVAFFEQLDALDWMDRWLALDRKVAKPDAPCRRCVDCVGEDHHWYEDCVDEDNNPVDPHWKCKHCPAMKTRDADEDDDDNHLITLPNGVKLARLCVLGLRSVWTPPFGLGESVDLYMLDSDNGWSCVGCLLSHESRRAHDIEDLGERQTAIRAAVKLAIERGPKGDDDDPYLGIHKIWEREDLKGEVARCGLVFKGEHWRSSYREDVTCKKCIEALARADSDAIVHKWHSTDASHVERAKCGLVLDNSTVSSMQPSKVTCEDCIEAMGLVVHVIKDGAPVVTVCGIEDLDGIRYRSRSDPDSTDVDCQKCIELARDDSTIEAVVHLRDGIRDGGGLACGAEFDANNTQAYEWSYDAAAVDCPGCRSVLDA